MGFLLGTFVGGLGGVLLMCLMFISKEADRRSDGLEIGEKGELLS